MLWPFLILLEWTKLLFTIVDKLLFCSNVCLKSLVSTCTATNMWLQKPSFPILSRPVLSCSNLITFHFHFFINLYIYNTPLPSSPSPLFMKCNGCTKVFSLSAKNILIPISLSLTFVRIMLFHKHTHTNQLTHKKHWLTNVNVLMHFLVAKLLYKY